MSRGKASGYTLTRSDAKTVLGMQAREDKRTRYCGVVRRESSTRRRGQGRQIRNFRSCTCSGITAEGSARRQGKKTTLCRRQSSSIALER